MVDITTNIGNVLYLFGPFYVLSYVLVKAR